MNKIITNQDLSVLKTMLEEDKVLVQVNFWQEWSGFYQTRDNKMSDNSKEINFNADFISEGFNQNYKMFDGSIFPRSTGELDNNWLLKQLNKEDVYRYPDKWNSWNEFAIWVSALPNTEISADWMDMFQSISAEIPTKNWNDSFCGTDININNVLVNLCDSPTFSQGSYLLFFEK